MKTGKEQEMDIDSKEIGKRDSTNNSSLDLKKSKCRKAH